MATGCSPAGGTTGTFPWLLPGIFAPAASRCRSSRSNTDTCRRDRSSSPFRRRPLREEAIDDIPVVRTFSYLLCLWPQRIFGRRAFSIKSFSVSCLFGLMRGPRPDVIHASSPPLVPTFYDLVGEPVSLRVTSGKLDIQPGTVSCNRRLLRQSPIYAIWAWCCRIIAGLKIMRKAVLR
jgi:hypothetical protein